MSVTHARLLNEQPTAFYQQFQTSTIPWQNHCPLNSQGSSCQSLAESLFSTAFLRRTVCPTVPATDQMLHPVHNKSRCLIKKNLYTTMPAKIKKHQVTMGINCSARQPIVSFSPVAFLHQPKGSWNSTKTQLTNIVQLINTRLINTIHN